MLLKDLQFLLTWFSVNIGVVFCMKCLYINEKTQVMTEKWQKKKKILQQQNYSYGLSDNLIVNSRQRASQVIVLN